jgi:hypothetical protein
VSSNLERYGVPAAMWLACSIVICVGILTAALLITGNTSLLGPKASNKPLIKFCLDDTYRFGNGCWKEGSQ